MGSKMLCIFILIATIAAIDADAPATSDIVIGGDKGWNFGVNITDWMSDKEVIRGDKLIFNYPAGKENVVEVDEASYESCTVPPNAKVLSSGHDIVEMNITGRRCFISGVENGSHCKAGLKFCSYIPEIIVNPFTTYHVGDDKGWNKGVDFGAWANGKEFHMNDELVFKYPKGKHNVIEIKEGSVHQCNIPQADQQEVHEDGLDSVLLLRTGIHQFISGIGNDCLEGMRLKINVLEKRPPKPLKGARKLIPVKD